MSEPEKEKVDLTADAGAGPGCLKTTITAVLAGVLLLVVAVLGISLEKIEAWEVGLRFWNLDIPPLVKKGDVNILDPGYNIVVPYLHRLNKYDASIQTFEMALNYPDFPEPDLPPLKVRAVRDQDDFEVYVTILYHINVEKAGALRFNYSNDREIRLKGIAAIAQQRLQEQLGRMMTASQFYEMSKKKRVEILNRRKTDPNYLVALYPDDDYLLDRTTLAYQAMEEMNMFFEPKGIEIMDVLIWDFKFKDEVEAAIIGSVIGTAKIDMEASLKEAEAARSEWERLLAENYAAVDAEMARGDAETRKLEAQAQQYLDQKQAAGRRLILEAQAEGKGRINQALGGRGGQVYVGMEYAEALKGIELIVLPSGGEGVNPLDADRTLRNMMPAGQ
jgi:regulator of protease activity HflC (stomatin/prohibitin superfamily)